VRAHDFPTFSFEGSAEDSFHPGLLGPAFLIGRDAEVTAGNQVNVLGFEGFNGRHILIVA